MRCLGDAMFEYGYQLDTSRLDRAVARYGASFSNAEDPIVRGGWVLLHAAYMSQQKKNFIARSKGQTVNGIGMARVAPLTAALRRKGGTRKIKTDEQLHRKAEKTVQPLRDTGMLSGSLTPGAPGNIQKIGVMRVQAGTAIKYAAGHQAGKTSKAPPVAQSLARLDANVARVLSPGKPPAKSGGTYSKDGTKVLVNIPGVGPRWVKRATKHHNPLFYRLRAAVKKRRPIKLKKRPILLDPTAPEGRDLEHVWGNFVLPKLRARFAKDSA